MNKFPKLIDKKWSRYSKIEKVFILYLFILLISEFLLPIIKIESVSYALLNTKFLLTSLILLFTLIFIIFWNTSFRFKAFIKTIFSFEQNDAILNFGVLFLHITILVFAKDMISLLSFSRSSDYYTLDYGFYILAWLLVLGLIWNLFLAIDLSIGNKKRAHYSKIVSSLPEQEKIDSKDVKSLFE
jgi:hypothetical protein